MSRSASAAAVLVLACVGATATTAAQERPRARFGIGLGLTAPLGDYRADASGEGFNAGWQGMGFMEFMRTGSHVGLRVDAMFGENPGNGQLNFDETGVDTYVRVKMRMLGGNLDVVYRFLRSLRGGRGYLLGGIGSYRVTRASTFFGATNGFRGVAEGMSETRFGWNAGGGLTYPVGGAPMFLEVRYFSITNPLLSSGKAPFVAIVAGVRFGRG